MQSIIEVQDFNDCTDSVRTEEIIWKNLEEYPGPIPLDCVFIKFPFADTINKKGARAAQEIVTHYASQFNDKKVVFICQHIQVTNIIFPPNAIVFTPHATTKDDFVPISHATKFKGPNATPPDRVIPFSFCGATYTHPCRSSLFQLFGGDPRFLLRQTNNWHFDKSPEEQSSLEKSYKSILSQSIFSLCPRGTGPSTIRIWDSLAMGSIPVIIADDLKLPLNDRVAWGDIIYRVKEGELSNILHLVSPLNIENKSSLCLNLFNKFFCDEKLHLQVLYSLIDKSPASDIIT